jgi:FAD/FMN-containing dehydrogenase
MLTKRKDMILDELVSIVGQENATAAKHIRYAYSYDLSFVTPKLPDYVVMVHTVEQIQDVLRFANREGIPVVPYTGGPISADLPFRNGAGYSWISRG